MVLLAVILAESETSMINHRKLTLVFLPGKVPANLEEIITLKINKTSHEEELPLARIPFYVYYICIYTHLSPLFINVYLTLIPK